MNCLGCLAKKGWAIREPRCFREVSKKRDNFENVPFAVDLVSMCRVSWEYCWASVESVVQIFVLLPAVISIAIWLA